MNREIKFRIWADNKFYNKCLVGNTNNANDEKWTCPMVWLEKQKEWVHCDNGIICQYTGLHDKNGKEIYEGDIIEWTTYSGKKYRFSVEYSNKYAQYVIVNTRDVLMEYEPLGDYENIEVIGNIYENSELLED